MPSVNGHKHTGSVTQNHKAQLANAYNELGKELSSNKIRVIGNYTLGRVIGEGAYGKVRMGTHRLTQTRVAIKQIPKAMSASLTREIHHHRQLHHPHVTQMYEVIATESSIWIVTELCCGGELFDYLAEKGRLSEDEARIMFGQLCLAVAYLHDNGIVHRDLKLENVLLDERCRVKLGDFGFTREFERGSFMETYCGTTGYASPEMLEGKKYQGPEVDVWSLGVILYCLLTGTLPFDDDDEDVMRQMIIQGDFEDPEWLSTESRDLIKDILQKDVAKRFTIPQILAHPWFTSPDLTYEPDDSPQPAEAPTTSDAGMGDSQRSSESSTMSTGDSSLISSSEFDTSAPTTPDESPNDPFEIAPGLHRNPSEATIRRTSDIESLFSKMNRSGSNTKPETVQEEDIRSPSPLPPRRNSSSSKAPPAHPVRTPARTKRRSVSSTLSDPASPTADKTPTPYPLPATRDLDFAALLTAPTPIIFSTPLERELLNTLSMLGFDTAQIVHSVLSDACDAAGAVWWMLKKKAEKRQIEEGVDSLSSTLPSVPDSPVKLVEPKALKKRKVSTGVQTDGGIDMKLAKSAPQLAFVPPTPTVPRSTTPPRPSTPSKSHLLTPSDTSSKSHPSTPASSLRDKETKARKARSGSVSIMQRATTALEAAGLVRKKSTEAVREEKEREKSKEMERRIASGEESRSSHGSGGSSKLTKSPPLKASKDHAPSTPPPSDLRHPQAQMGSPWVLADAKDVPSHSHAGRGPAPTPANTPGGGFPQSISAPNFSDTASKPPATAPQRNRASILTAFRLWFNEDRKGKRKDTAGGGINAHLAYNRPLANATPTFTAGTAKRRGSSGSRFARGHRQRPSASSRRSSSVNSRRSSGTSVQMLVMDSPQVATRRSFGSHTPNSERGEYPSRPSSIRSFSMQRHRKSPSQSSAGSTHLRTASPMQKYHRRAGSGSSTTRVVRQVTARPPHARSNSATSSIHSPPSSRPASFYELSENEAPRTTSPFKVRTRRSSDESRRPSSTSNTTTFVAQKRQGPFMSPVSHHYSHSFGRSSWKKAWGLEPPGWQSRTAHLPIEVLAISPATEPMSIRDVFSARQSLSLGDESDWVDEDDDVPFAGGLGQMGTSVMSAMAQVDPPVTLSPAPRGHRSAKRASGRDHGYKSASSSGSASSGSGRQKAGHSPGERASPIPAENPYETETRSGGRRGQLPASRSGPAFRHAIQEEDEGEEE
ncbi:putative kinase-like [Lyophyllum shimeji]|uniref:Kinase-like n=1 Tax=Lyophyllum shimeji TaxID=47721 RepID=A0A9P3UQ74_LYOSH|nr:putative kinase-like [Lyophyllum shimeji]